MNAVTARASADAARSQGRGRWAAAAGFPPDAGRMEAEWLAAAAMLRLASPDMASLPAGTRAPQPATVCRVAAPACEARRWDAAATQTPRGARSAPWVSPIRAPSAAGSLSTPQYWP